MEGGDPSYVNLQERAGVPRPGPRLSSAQDRAPVHLVYNSARDAHAVEDGDVDDCRHSSVVDGLGAVRPHVGTLSQIYVAGAQTRKENTARESGALGNDNGATEPRRVSTWQP